MYGTDPYDPYSTVRVPAAPWWLTYLTLVAAAWRLRHRTTV
jgi:hypothetical protein